MIDRTVEFLPTFQPAAVMHADGLTGLSCRSRANLEIDILQSGRCCHFFAFGSNLFKRHTHSLFASVVQFPGTINGCGKKKPGLRGNPVTEAPDTRPAERK